VFLALAVVLAEGGGVSCYRTCTATQQFLDDAGDVGTVIAACVSLAIGWWVSGREPLGRITTIALAIGTCAVAAVLLVEAAA